MSSSEYDLPEFWQSAEEQFPSVADRMQQASDDPELVDASRKVRPREGATSGDEWIVFEKLVASRYGLGSDESDELLSYFTQLRRMRGY